MRNRFIEELRSLTVSNEETQSFLEEGEEIQPKYKNSPLGSKDSKAKEEKELVYYIKLTNFDQLAKASDSETHDQWEIKVEKAEDNATEGKVRVRRTVKGGEAHFGGGETIYTSTVKNASEDGNYESTTRTSRAFYTQFKSLCKYGMHKHRYMFPIKGTNLQWGIDVYPDGRGGYYAWGRAEIEFKTSLEKVPELPIDVVEVISPEAQQTEEGKEKVAALFRDVFLVPNTMPEEIGQALRKEDKEKLEEENGLGGQPPREEQDNQAVQELNQEKGFGDNEHGEQQQAEAQNKAEAQQEQQNPQQPPQPVLQQGYPPPPPNQAPPKAQEQPPASNQPQSPDASPEEGNPPPQEQQAPPPNSQQPQPNQPQQQAPQPNPQEGGDEGEQEETLEDDDLFGDEEDEGDDDLFK